MSDAHEPKYCRLRREGSVLLVAIARPDEANALHPPASAELGRVFDAFLADPALSVAILTGVGDASFCAGLDPKYLEDQGAAPLPASGFGGLTNRIHATKPIIAAVNGEARGEGFELALACDLIVAVESATFALDQSRSGRTAGAPAVRRLLRQLPAKRAMAALLTGEAISAPEGVALGFVNDLARPGEALSLAREWAERILRCGPEGVRDVLRVARDALHESR